MIPLGFCDVGDLLDQHDTGIVDQNIEPPRFRFCQRDEILDVLLRLDITLSKGDSPGLKFANDIHWLVDIAAENTRPLVSQYQRDGPADPTGRSGDHGCTPRQISLH